MKKVRVIISGGGTGGHIYPGIAIAHQLKELNSESEILFVGAEGKMEMQKVPKAGFEIIGLPIRGLERKLSLKNLVLPFRILMSLWKARKILKKFKADIVIGTGGYASAAMMQVAAWSKTPTLIHESNGYAGLANKLLASQVSKICVAYPNMEKFFPKEKIVITGNPIRKDLVNLEAIKAEAYQYFGLDSTKKTLFVMGGSGGAKTLNTAMLNGVKQLLEAGYQLIWQTGSFYLKEVQEKTKVFPIKKNLYISDFIYKMPYAYACTDVSITRAGALTISELALTQKASILVPSPNVTEDHQTKNATALVNREAALLVKDADVPQELIKTALDLLSNEKKQDQLRSNIVQMASPDAAKKIVDEVIKLV